MNEIIQVNNFFRQIHLFTATLLYRSFIRYFDFKTSRLEIDHLKTIFRKTIILWVSMIRVLNHFLVNCIHLKLLLRMYLKEMFLYKLPSLGSISFQTWKKLQKLFSDKLTSCNLILSWRSLSYSNSMDWFLYDTDSAMKELKITFTSPVRVKSFFTFKDNLPKMLLSGIVY